MAHGPKIHYPDNDCWYWKNWVTGTTTTSAACISTTSNTSTASATWDLWTDSDAFGGTTITFNPVWHRWVSVEGEPADYYDVVRPRGAPVATFAPSIINAEQRARYEQEQIDRQRQREAFEAEQRAAEQRAEALLMSCLTLRQRAEYQQHRHFVVHGRSGQRYRIRPGRMANIDVVGRDGHISHRLCFHPSVDCPTPDTMLAQKLMLEDDESVVLKVANRHSAMEEARRTRILPVLQ